jgi:hypothetical protein
MDLVPCKIPAWGLYDMHDFIPVDMVNISITTLMAVATSCISYYSLLLFNINNNMNTLYNICFEKYFLSNIYIF